MSASSKRIASPGLICGGWPKVSTRALRRAPRTHPTAAGIITTRDPVMEADAENRPDEHGFAFDRVSAFQLGFINGTPARGDRRGRMSGAAVICRRRCGLRCQRQPRDRRGRNQRGYDPSTLMELMGKIFSPKNPPIFLVLPAGRLPRRRFSPPGRLPPSGPSTPSWPTCPPWRWAGGLGSGTQPAAGR